MDSSILLDDHYGMVHYSLKGLLAQNIDISECWVVLPAFFPVCKVLKKNFKKNLSASHSLDPDQARHIAWSDLAPSYLQRLSAGEFGHHLGERVKK